MKLVKLVNYWSWVNKLYPWLTFEERDKLVNIYRIKASIASKFNIWESFLETEVQPGPRPL